MFKLSRETGTIGYESVWSKRDILRSWITWLCSKSTYWWTVKQEGDLGNIWRCHSGSLFVWEKSEFCLFIFYSEHQLIASGSPTFIEGNLWLKYSFQNTLIETSQLDWNIWPHSWAPWSSQRDKISTKTPWWIIKKNYKCNLKAEP